GRRCHSPYRHRTGLPDQRSCTFSPGNLQSMTVIHNNPVSEITFHNGSPVLYSNVRERWKAAVPPL
ncbi:hypothetical protein, partial [Bacteroides faecalis]|uniref:hypothetical protein n=1 Tax=Bacteroides faecalis TaxID=2447885 RepID=UPI001F30991E